MSLLTCTSTTTHPLTLLRLVVLVLMPVLGWATMVHWLPGGWVCRVVRRAFTALHLPF